MHEVNPTAAGGSPSINLGSELLFKSNVDGKKDGDGNDDRIVQAYLSERMQEQHK